MCMSGELGHTNPFVKRRADSLPVGQLRINNLTVQAGGTGQYCCLNGVSSGPFNG